ncbi:hypothetical protein TNCV_868411 [Trichonephila clavipes]|nr:hypothetical protein TNCV_868411 [Trichonephila clavipes]
MLGAPCKVRFWPLARPYGGLQKHNISFRPLGSCPPRRGLRGYYGSKLRDLPHMFRILHLSNLVVKVTDSGVECLVLLMIRRAEKTDADGCQLTCHPRHLTMV